MSTLTIIMIALLGVYSLGMAIIMDCDDWKSKIIFKVIPGLLSVYVLFIVVAAFYKWPI